MDSASSLVKWYLKHAGHEVEKINAMARVYIFDAETRGQIHIHDR